MSQDSALPTAQTASATAVAPPSGEAAGIRLLAELRSEIARADSKAAVLVAALGVVVGLLGSVAGGGGWDLHTRSIAGTVLLAIAVVHLAASLSALLLAVVPRYERSRWTPGRPLSYFGDICRAVELGALAEGLADSERAAVPGLLTALADTGAIVARKHFWVRLGILCFGLGTLLLPPALLLG